MFGLLSFADLWSKSIVRVVLGPRGVLRTVNLADPSCH
ncbi:hypothetical protein BTZ20_3489 [Rhodococcus sp. MTM3W5.2]|nr:hypothetical protein BTZ20_3489 [Rhodococcus sp. MTM3W5.2]